jgi:hypothetical protein
MAVSRHGFLSCYLVKQLQVSDISDQKFGSRLIYAAKVTLQGYLICREHSRDTYDARDTLSKLSSK